jgi:hypothetical protein
MFARDRDLLALEPNLFKDIAWAGQRLISCIGSVAGDTLTIAPVNADFATAQITSGHVVLVDGVTYEVVEVLSATTATISRLRADPSGPTLPPDAGSNLAVSLATFVPQLATVHNQLLRLLDIEPGDPDAFPAEANITNPGALAAIEAVGALHLIFTAAAALAPPGSSLWTRVAHYRARITEERPRAAVLLDLDGDGAPDATRRLSTFALLRA